MHGAAALRGRTFIAMVSGEIDLRLAPEAIVGFREWVQFDQHEAHQKSDVYVCPAGKELASTGTLVNDGATLLYRASKYDCDVCELKLRCCPNMPPERCRAQSAKTHGTSSDIARTEAYMTSRRERKKIEMLFAHPILMSLHRCA
jgi:hypothetical protein